jgi:tetratricopeptide (TPR) repeat protein
VGPSIALGRDTKIMHEILDKTVGRLSDLRGQPAVEADLRETLGTVYLELGEYSTAEVMLRKAWLLRRTVNGGESIQIAGTLDSLAEVLWRQGKLAEAEIMQRSALALRSKLLPPEHLDLAASLAGLAAVVWREGKLQEAESLERRALAIRRNVLGNKDERVAGTLDGLAAILWTRRQLEEAERLAREGLDMRRRLFGDEHPSVAVSLNNLANVLRDRGKSSEAESCHRKALAIRLDLLGQQHPLVANSLANLAALLHDEGKLVEAEQLAARCLALREKELPSDWRTFSARSLLGSILNTRKRFTEAEPLLLSGYAGMKQMENTLPAEERLRLKETIQHLVRLYESTDCPDRVARWKLELTEWYRQEVAQRRQAAEGNEPQALSAVAWLLATCEDSAVRDGPGAVAYAEKAVEATNTKNPAFLATLAAAHAETGDFPRAVSLQKEAMAMAQAESLKKDLTVRLKLYESNIPYRER